VTAFPTFAPEPEKGRVFRARRAVRIGDTTASGRLRLDAIARYLQDVGNDDTLDLGLGDGGAWVCRRVHVAVLTDYPSLRDLLEIATFCGGVGSRWAERRTSLRCATGARIETATLWVHLDPVTMRPAPVPAWFVDHYGEACGDRKVDHRLHLPLPSDDAATRAWPLRATDFDVLAHVNNAIAFAALEDCWTRLGRTDAPTQVTVEYLGALDPGDAVELRWTETADGVDCWLVADGAVRVAVRATSAG